MKLALLMFVPILAIGAECETVTYQQNPAPSVSKPRRIGLTTGVPRIHRKTVPRKTVSTPRITRVVSRFDCPPPYSGSHPPIPGLPPSFIGTPPVWGHPYPMPPPIGPAPIYPGTPNDFPPGISIPPTGSSPPGFPSDHPRDVPEPPTITLLLFGLSILVARKYIK